MQWNQHIKQADEAIATIERDIEILDAIPEDETKSYNQKRGQWEEARQRHQAVSDEVRRSKENAEREMSTVQSETSSARQKKERLQARKVKLNDQLEKLEAALASEGPGRDREIGQSAARELQRAKIEQDFRKEMQMVHQAWQESRYNLSQYIGQIQALQNEQQMASPATGFEGRPITPEGDLPGENSRNSAAVAPRLPAFGTPESGGLRSHSGSMRHSERLRSSSLQSGNSNYVDPDEPDPAPPMPFRAAEAIREARKRSGGSAGGSSGSNSQRDPASPVGSRAQQDSPLGKKSPVWNQ